MKEILKVKRITAGCCGMKLDQIYTARWANPGVGSYVEVLVNGEWSSHHWFKGCFEVVK